MAANRTHLIEIVQPCSGIKAFVKHFGRDGSVHSTLNREHARRMPEGEANQRLGRVQHVLRLTKATCAVVAA